MWELNPPDGYPGKIRFKGYLGRKCTGGLRIVFFCVRQCFVTIDRGRTQSCDPMGVVNGPYRVDGFHGRFQRDCGYKSLRVGSF